MHFKPFVIFLVAPFLYGSVVSALQSSEIELGRFYHVRPQDFKGGGIVSKDGIRPDHEEYLTIIALRRPRDWTGMPSARNADAKRLVDVAIICPTPRPHSDHELGVRPASDYGIPQPTRDPILIYLEKDLAFVGGLINLFPSSRFQGIKLGKRQLKELQDDMKRHREGRRMSPPALESLVVVSH